MKKFESQEMNVLCNEPGHGGCLKYKYFRFGIVNWGPLVTQIPKVKF